LTSFQPGVSAIPCPGGESSTLDLANRTKQIIDTAGADRQWITSNGPRVFISYHDSVGDAGGALPRTTSINAAGRRASSTRTTR
jgi:hypothetical protein